MDTYLVKPVKQSRLFDCLVNTIVTDPVRDIVAKSELSAPTTHLSQSNPQPAKARILLAEDNRINQLVAVSLLRKLGYGVDVVANGLAALEALNSNPYDIIFMDCQMPEMDGYSAARAIRLREQNSGQGSNGISPVYIIAITANAMEGDPEKCLAAGMNDYLSKPFRLPELQAALERRNENARKATFPPVPAGESALNTILQKYSG
jgi:CheY-like chemotaxis protein